MPYIIYQVIGPTRRSTSTNIPLAVRLLCLVISKVIGPTRRSTSTNTYKPAYEKVNYYIVESESNQNLTNHNTINGKRLSSEALYTYYSKKDTDGKIVLLKPISINDADETIIDDTIIDENIKPKVCVKSIPAIGVYKGKEYKSTPADISVRIFMHMIEDFYNKSYDNIIIDLSTGYNLYVMVLVEATRFFIIYNRLYKGDIKAKTPVKYAISEPIVSTDENKKIFVYEFDTRTTFDLPQIYKFTDCIEGNGLLKKKIGEEWKGVTDKISKLYNKLKFMYNALIYNTPLALFHFKDDIDISINPDDCVKDTDDLVKEIICMIKETNGIDTNNSINLNRKVYQIFLLLAFYKGLRDLIYKKVSKREATLSDLKGFKDIYNKLDLGLNWRFLEREIEEIEYYGGNVKEEWKLYKDIISGNTARDAADRRDKPIRSNIKRNFFAHAGLSYDTIELKKEGGEILCRYTCCREKEIKKWINHPDK